MKKKYKILERSESCVLLEDKTHPDFYKVMDIENYCIAMGCYTNCKIVFDDYDINKVREERKRQFENWLKDYAEA